ncbi:hypothetical protein [Micromonospora sp. NPDC048830]|uniref:hypothetical protein n=1 Tax=Micromonospora sp. NPDC048830 TaxID=3364257 RepID=UPI00371B99EA
MQPKEPPPSQTSRPPLVPAQPFTPPAVPIYHGEPIRPAQNTAGTAPAQPPAPQPHQALTARLTHWSAAEQVVADVVAALDQLLGQRVRPSVTRLLVGGWFG